jgi:hypothetical protein
VTSWIPFAVDAVSFGVSSTLVAAIPARRTARGTGEASPPGGRTSLRIEIAEGLRWLFAHRVLRAVAALVAGVNIALTGSDAIMVLFAQERLGLGSVGFGLLFTGSAVGGAVGGVVAPWLSRRLGSVPVMTGGFIVAGIASVGIGLTHNPWVAGLKLVRPRPPAPARRDGPRRAGGLRALQLDPGSGRMVPRTRVGRSALRAATPPGEGASRGQERNAPPADSY